ncbi:Gx transporter family protein [Erysipelothrix inopinata]|uniref:Gx transporter family protein n=1 Tax=Erysipelothrix inopinata TaxID=225084 RepID=A0A7G9RWV8_9FIRM|nr:Gx transporter family protein [Erysipelothrix inopinata]QNN60083.1 Gx transporter family protein [Erysipelothrix inopinata]
MKPQNKTKRLTLLTMLLGMAMIVNMLEPSLPFAFPGIKLGLANVLGLFALYFLGVREMYIVNIMRVLLVSLVRGTFLGAGFWPAFIGSLVSCTMVVLFRKFTNMSEVGISAASATFHNVGQILVIVFYFNSPFMISYLPIMLLLGIPTGILTGYLVQAINKRFKIS